MFFHYTCLHVAGKVSADGFVRPRLQPFLGREVGWFTDLEPGTFEPYDLGLQAEVVVTCDRTEVCFQVVDHPSVSIEPWREWAERERVDRRIRSELEFGRKHRHWFVSAHPVAVRLYC